MKSFSPRNLLYMHQYYRLFPDAMTNLPEGDVNNTPMIAKQPVSQSRGANAKQVVSQMNLYQAIFLIPWGHLVQLINRCGNDSEKALFYIQRTFENNWSRAVMMNFLDSNLYERQGKAITNFDLTLPAPQSDLAQSITKDPYNFDFLTIQGKYNEKELKDALINDVSNFLLELIYSMCQNQD